MKKIALLCMSYGTPYNEADILPYYTHIRHGHMPTTEEYIDLKERYEFIGGVSPLAITTQKQAEALCNTLNTMTNDINFKLYIGLKHIHPFIEDAIDDISKDGIEEIVSVVLTPHYSSFSVEMYNKRVTQYAEDKNIKVTTMKQFYEEEKFIKYWTDSINDQLKLIPEYEYDQTAIIISAHSLPEKILAHDDPYADQLQETAHLIQEKIGHKYIFNGWQSEGNTTEPWIGPDVQDLTYELVGKYRFKNFIYVPLGFTCEHLEVLYDNDYECKKVCDELGCNYYRAEMPGSNQLFIDAIANSLINNYKVNNDLLIMK
ncbi:ferrochelatase [Staphylococcus hominis subsp. hominis]|nr:ferrochelatase [Staphylococcus hominis]AYY66316.1 ferrochelatase [Staphylococcus hominis]PNZ31675.1 ferrochelatase [Staphylococcus hominis subsp. hominis]UQA65691.1 ferrochelatase [Staphylococcus hominis subsp. hominis]SUM40626.1 ferrochelatase [Staphylococcus hominis]